MATHLVIAEHDGISIKKSTLSTISAARKIKGNIYGFVFGKNVLAVADMLSDFVDFVHVFDENIEDLMVSKSRASLIFEVARSVKATHVWASATVFGKDTMPRVAVKLSAAMASDIKEVVSENVFKRPMWAGNVIGTIELLTEVKVVTVRSSEFPVTEKRSSKGIVSNLSLSFEKSLAKLIAFNEVRLERPSLGDAKVIVSGGRGVKSADGFKSLIEPLADKLGAAVGASRAVCDAGWAPNDWQVGQTGKIVAPDLYIAVGISGAIQHVAGMKGSKVIVAINKDPDAPIFQIADYGIVGDAFELVPELIKGLT